MSTLSPRVLKFVCALCAFTLMALAARAEPLMIVTEDLAPYNYLEDGEALGMSTEVVQAVLEETGQSGDIRFLPWARSYNLALTRPNTLIYSIARTPEREDLFAWVGQIAPYGASLYKLADNESVGVQTLEDARHLSVGVYIGDVKEASLKRHGFDNLSPTEDDRLNLRKLMLGRIDLIAIDDNAIGPLLTEEGINRTQLKRTVAIDDVSGFLYMAFQKDTDPVLVEMFRQGLQTIKDEGIHDEILTKYILIN
ncbi:transporter substrate-binding domain-containing protein [Roseibium denhamense]|uniref:Amino acid ABC transporter substrate-binding protein, PAAT family n=1 Tax=Roseibium denhamense TaxID=76305 RepID=A0ABY1NDU0_9HYPH|nr:transporter substrate-binding domain-containing protein [Roseibium denhamense]MTI04301.1 transporter substrate-binding domain-containing protein [Roseibium denhamense]SMP07175.1 amino acid ABC transporter substrate-binding protein, PAAT family [Roseibium denhamense]